MNDNLSNLETGENYAQIFLFGIEKDTNVPRGNGIIVSRRKICPELYLFCNGETGYSMHASWHENHNSRINEMGKEVAKFLKRKQITKYDLILGNDPRFANTKKSYPDAKEVNLEKKLIDEFEKGLIEGLKVE